MTTAEMLKILNDAQKQIAAEGRRMDVVLFHAYDDGERTYSAKSRRFRTVDAARKAARKALRECGGEVTITENGRDVVKATRSSEV